MVLHWLTKNGVTVRVVGCAHACGFGSRGVKLSFNIPLQLYFIPDVQMVIRERENVSHSLTLQVL